MLSGWLNQQLLQAAQRLWEEFELAMEERKSQLRQQLAESEARMLQVKAPDEAQRRGPLGTRPLKSLGET